MYKRMSLGHEYLQLILRVATGISCKGVTLAWPEYVSSQVKEWKHEGQIQE